MTTGFDKNLMKYSDTEVTLRRCRAPTLLSLSSTRALSQLVGQVAAAARPATGLHHLPSAV